MYGRLAIITAAIALAGGLPAMPATAAAPRAPQGTKVVTGTGRGTQYDHLGLLAGSPGELLYVSRAGWAGDLNADPAHDTSSATPELMVRDIDGTTHDLGVAPEDVRWSTEGKLVTGLRYDANGYEGLVDVWSFGAHGVTHRAVKVPTSVTWIGTTPSGFAYADGGTLRFWDSATATRANYGIPFPGQTIGTLQTAQTNLVVTGLATGISLMSYSQPGTFTPLNIGTQTGPAFCDALDADGAACGQDNSSEMFVRLDGSAPTVSNGGGGTSNAMSGTTILYTRDDSDTTPLYSFSASDPNVIRSSGVVDFTLVSAYGKALFLPYGDASNHHVLEATSASDIRSAFTISRSPDTAGPFALTSPRIVYVSDLLDPARPHQPLRVRSVDLRATTSHVSLSAPQDIGRALGSARIYPAVVAATGDTTAYIVDTVTQGTLVSAHVVVHTARGTVQLKPTPDFGTLQAAGDWVAYTSGSGIELYNSRTGHAHKILKGQRPSSWTLTPTHLAYGDDLHAAVKWFDLATGTATTVYRSPRHTFASITVAAFGDRVAWDISRNPSKHVDAMRTMPGGRIVHLAHEVYGMSGAGVLMSSAPVWEGVYTTWLQPFGGTPHLVLSQRGFDEPPQIFGHALAWVSIDGNLKVAPYRY